MFAKWLRTNKQDLSKEIKLANIEHKKTDSKIGARLALFSTPLRIVITALQVLQLGFNVVLVSAITEWIVRIDDVFSACPLGLPRQISDLTGKAKKKTFI